jgi:hypothetical protein
VELTPLSSVLLQLLITLLFPVAWTGCLEVGFLSYPLFCELGPPLPCFCCCIFADPNSHLFHCLNFAHFDNISISGSPVRRCPRNPSLFGCTYVGHLWYFKTRCHSESLIPNFECKVWKMLVYSGTIWSLSLMQSHPSHVLVIIVSNRVEFLLEGINKGHPSGSCPKCHRLIFIMSLPVTFPPIFDMGKGFKERVKVIFLVSENFFFNRVITL